MFLFMDYGGGDDVSSSNIESGSRPYYDDICLLEAQAILCALQQLKMSDFDGLV